jgi:hypothetical protein
MLHMLQCLYTMLQAPILNVSSVFFRCMLQVCLSKCYVNFHTYDASVFIWTLRMFTMVLSIFQVFLQVFQTHV